eukprot:TRINITY_DN6129_c0_g1_i1.p1 TRINITY_DN6129_c0_g1~~TRINITY_DN6129_c0_g1_i1.p1  ORF type:complete len:470 (+),score=115.32 TRINITY_DN6129_c0_g1_i1:310-1719(+)
MFRSCVQKAGDGATMSSCGGRVWSVSFRAAKPSLRNGPASRTVATSCKVRFTRNPNTNTNNVTSIASTASSSSTPSPSSSVYFRRCSSERTFSSPSKFRSIKPSPSSSFPRANNQSNLHNNSNINNSNHHPLSLSPYLSPIARYQSSSSVDDTTTVPHASTTTSHASTSLRETLGAYAALSKPRLSALVAATAMAGYALAPGPFIVSHFVWSTIGTCLAISSANTFNQVMEVDTDSKMARTMRRPLPLGVITKQHAMTFGLGTGAAGSALLCAFVNPVAAGLAMGNILLYALAYTPLKRIHPSNTLVGSIVGGVPPMIGWASRTGGLEPGAWLFGGLLFLWQLPHFHALSWNLKADYARGGYKMLINVSPEKVAPSCFRWALATIPIGAAFALAGTTSWVFAADSLLLNGYLINQAWNFRQKSDGKNARKLFRTTLWYLPAIMGLLLLHRTPDEVADVLLAVESESESL